MRLLIATIGIVFIVHSGFASTINETRAEIIRNSPEEYYYGDGYGASIEEANANAARTLTQSIQTYIQSEQIHLTQETTSTLVDTFTSRTKLESNVYIQDLVLINLGMVGETHHVLAYISKEDFTAGIQRQKDRIRALVAQAENVRLRADIGSAIRDAYWAYLLSHTVPDTLDLGFDTHITYDPKLDLLFYMKKLLSDLTFSASPAMKSGMSIIVPINVTYKHKPVRSLELEYYDGSTGMQIANLSSGFGYLELNLLSPFPRYYTVRVKVEYADEGSMKHIEVIEDLYRLLGEDTISESSHKIGVEIPFGELTIFDEPELPSPHLKITSPIPIPVDDTDDFSTSKQLWPLSVITLAEIQDTPVFLEALEIYERNNRLQYDKNGPESLANAGLDMYLALADASTVHAVLHFADNQYVDVKSNIRITNLSEAFKGEDLFQIWIGLPHETR